MPTALIVGGGIGGLAAAIALARQDWQVRIYEQAAALNEVGAGLQLGPNATRILETWGLLESLRAVGFQPQALQARDWCSGQILSEQALGAQAQSDWGAPYLQLHRADLQQVLAQAVAGFAHCSLHLGQAVTEVDPDAGCLRANGQSHQGDLIIGADGIHSVVRRSLFGPQRPRYTGQTAWRLLIPSTALASARPPPYASLWLGPGKHLVHYFVQGGRLLNCVGVVEKADWQTESWTEQADFAALAADFSDAHGDIRSIIAAAAGQACFRWALFDRAPLPSWQRHTTTLLGDACHPTLPFLAQGAAMAIEDAAVLADTLHNEPDVVRALPRYWRRRIQRTRWIQQASARNARIFHLRGAGAAARNLLMRSGVAGPEKLATRLYAFDALAHQDDPG